MDEMMGDEFSKPLPNEMTILVQHFEILKVSNKTLPD